MPNVIRQTLATRLVDMPQLEEMLADFTLVAGVPVRFLPLSSNGSGVEPGALCARLGECAAGARLCRAFRQKLRDGADEQAKWAGCDAGLWEAMVPVRVSTQTVGHLLVSGCRESAVTVAGQNRVRHLLGRAGVALDRQELAGALERSRELSPAHREALLRVLRLGAERLAGLLTEHLVSVPASASPLVDQVCRQVHAGFADEIRLPDVAARLGVSTGHLSRTFHHATGLRFVDYVARFRAERARALLAEGRLGVAEVARACGFASVSQFNRVFRAKYGASPRALRARLPAGSAGD